MEDEERTPPVTEGQEIEVRIDSIGSKGDGVARYEGFVIFVPGTQQGEVLKVQIKEVRATFAIGERA